MSWQLGCLTGCLVNLILLVVLFIVYVYSEVLHEHIFKALQVLPFSSLNTVKI